MWSVAPADVISHIIEAGVLGVADMTQVLLLNKHWRACVQPHMNALATHRLHEVMECQKVAQMIMRPVVKWDLGEALLFRDLFKSDDFKSILQRFYNFPVDSWAEALAKFHSSREKHHALTDAVFRAPLASLRDMHAALNPSYDHYDLEFTF